MDTTIIPFRLACLHASSPEGGSTIALQPGANSATQHKWPLRPGVQVHVNGPNTLSLAASGSVLLSPSDLQAAHDQLSSSSSNSGSRPSSANSNDKTKRADQRARTEAGNSTHPYYETVREKKRSAGSRRASQMTDSGSESTRSVIRVQGPSRIAKFTAPPPPPFLHHQTPQRMSSGTNAATTLKLRLHKDIIID